MRAEPVAVWPMGNAGTRRAAAMLGEMDPSEADGMLPRRNVLVSCGVEGPRL